MSREEGRIEQAERITREASSLLDLSRRALAAAQEGSDRAAVNLQEADELMATNPEALTLEGLEALARDYPLWAVKSEIFFGELRKTYTRLMPDLIEPTNAEGRRALVSRLTDYEYFDRELAQVFGAYGGDGDLGGPFPAHFSITAQEAGPITVGDAYRIMKAEEYLRHEGLIRAAEDQPAAEELAS